MGCFCKCLDESDDYEKCIQISDAIMYENKKRNNKVKEAGLYYIQDSCFFYI